MNHGYQAARLWPVKEERLGTSTQKNGVLCKPGQPLIQGQGQMAVDEAVKGEVSP